jgi:hypothetical protein
MLILLHVSTSFVFQPTQQFFTETLGLPVRMTPDFETKACQMSFGVAPLPLEEDPAHQSGCLAGCKMSGSFEPTDAPVAGTEKKCYAAAPAYEKSSKLAVPH